MPPIPPPGRRVRVELPRAAITGTVRRVHRGVVDVGGQLVPIRLIRRWRPV